MTLEDLVPPVELCKRLPAGEFGETALVWVEREDQAWVADSMTRVDFFDGLDYYPAPALAEIMAELPELLIAQKRKLDPTLWNITTGKSDGGWNTNAATSALRLWFKLKGVECE